MQRPYLRNAFWALTCAALASWLPAACGGRSETGDFLQQSDASADPDSGADTSGEGPEMADADEEGNRPGDDRDDGPRDDPGEGAEPGRADGDGAPDEPDDEEEGAGGARQGDGEQGEEEDPDRAPTPMPGAHVDCAGVSCNPLSHVCCVGLIGTACIPEDEPCNGAELLCTANRDCAEGAVCCLQEIGGRDAFASCRESCGSRPGSRQRQLCQRDDECARGRCRPTPFGVSVCRGGS